MSNAASVGRSLAARHRRRAEPDSTSSVLNYAESPRADDWTLRSALVRLAQPEPTRSGAVLELVRRCDAALHPLVRNLQSETVLCDRDLTGDLLAVEATEAPAVDQDDETATPGSYPDARVVDLARLALDAPDQIGDVLEAYGSRSELSEEERLALPLIEVALRLDELGEVLTRWACEVEKQSAPIDVVDQICADAFARLEEIGVPREQGPPRGRSRD